MALNLFGNSSALFNWDRTKDAFRFAAVRDEASYILSVEAISEASVSRRVFRVTYGWNADHLFYPVS